jgi:hypothetical protein
MWAGMRVYEIQEFAHLLLPSFWWRFPHFSPSCIPWLCGSLSLYVLIILSHFLWGGRPSAGFRRLYVRRKKQECWRGGSYTYSCEIVKCNNNWPVCFHYQSCKGGSINWDLGLVTVKKPGKKTGLNGNGNEEIVFFSNVRTDHMNIEAGGGMS